MAQLIWVAIPDGRVSGDKALIRVLVVPRLVAGHISDVGMSDWPAVLQDTEFLFVTKTPTGHAVEHQAEYVREASSDIWKEFFSGTGGNIDPLNLIAHSAPTVNDTYRDLRDVTDTSHAVVTQLADMPEQPDSIVETQLSAWKRPITQQPAADGDPTNPIPDFHRTVSMLREHSSVLRTLGLIICLHVDAGALDRCRPVDGFTLSVRAASPALLTTGFVVSPWTRYEFGPNIFRPAPGPESGSGVRTGLLDLRGADLIPPAAVRVNSSPPAWALATFDVDGAASAFRQAATSLSPSPVNSAASQTREPGEPDTTRTALPAVRSRGLSLLRPGWTTDLAERSRREAHRTGRSLHGAELTADDLVLGYRVDIKAGDEEWLPLCERDATYTVNGHRIRPTDAPQPEEGHLSPFSAVKVGNQLYTDQLVVRWEGWSLAAPIVRLAPDPLDTPPPGASDDLPYRFGWEFSLPPGRLPRLRFGTRYAMRVRVADLAGGGVRFEDVLDDTSAASATIVYTRHDPLPPPTLQSDVAHFPPGAAIDRMVIRSDRGKAPQDLQDRNPLYLAVDTRRLVAPRASLNLVEQHGVLDDRTDEDSWKLASRAIAADPDDPTAGLADPAAAGINARIASASGATAGNLETRVKWSPRWPDMAPKSVKLDDTAGSIAVSWSADTLTLNVGVPQGDHATIELTSTIRDGWQDNFTVGEWLPSGSVSMANTMNGRNPAVTPPVRLEVVHAVRQPLADPLWRLSPDAVVRGEHGSSVLLKPRFEAVPPGQDGLHTASTGRLDVTAHWTETDDSGPAAATTTRAQSNDHFFSADIYPGPPPDLQIRHEFGDTKHRVIGYALHAITRYRHYFDEIEGDENFRLSKEQAPVVIPSSARPDPLTILGMLPAFRWQQPTVGGDRIEHVRFGNRIRVELARPWYQTGGGELVGVVIATGTAHSDGPVTQMGRDPLFGTPPLPQFPSTADFVNTAGATATVQLAEAGGPVTLVPYEPTPGSDRWYADIAFNPRTVGSSYNPFVKLAMGRFQPSSLRGLELSAVIETDAVQLLPDRRITAVRNGSQVVVTIAGTGPNPANNITATLERASGAGAELVVTDTAPGDVPAWIELSRVSGTLGAALPPLTLPAGPEPVRMRITESEALESISPHSSHTALFQRNVLIDTFELPAQWRR